MEMLRPFSKAIEIVREIKREKDEEMRRLQRIKGEGGRMFTDWLDDPKSFDLKTRLDLVETRGVDRRAVHEDYFRRVIQWKLYGEGR